MQGGRLRVPPSSLWVHGLTPISRAPSPDVAFGALASSMAVNGLGELSSIHARWFDHVLNDAPDPRLPGALVYVMGENRWHAFDELPPEPTPG